MSVLSWRRRFTVIELLVTIGIIIILTTFLVMGLRGAGAKAQAKATKALIERIKVALDNYYGQFRDYPPDGYDDESLNHPSGGAVWGGPPTADGVLLGSGGNAYRMKGTSTLFYFLCRPVVKISYSGSAADARNIVLESVGPFLELGAENYSRTGFNPAHPFLDNTYWDTNEFRKTEIIDPFFRPLHYDKVKAYPGGDPSIPAEKFKYFQPDRFHKQHGATTTTGSNGMFCHSDQQFLTEQVLPLDDNEMQCPTDTGSGNTHDFGIEALSEDEKLRIHTDPRWHASIPNGPQGDGCAVSDYTGTMSDGDDTTHAPRFLGGYDVWSHGMSYTSPRDDIVSWD